MCNGTLKRQANIFLFDHSHKRIGMGSAMFCLLSLLLLSLLLLSTMITTSVYGWTSMVMCTKGNDIRNQRNKLSWNKQSTTVDDESRVLFRSHHHQHHVMIMKLSSSADSSSSSSEQDDTLIYGDDKIQQYIQELRTKYPTSENAYLAASRLRAQQKIPSRTDTATDDDWQRISREKKQQMPEHDDDMDWQSSAIETSGQAESQILFFPDSTPTSSNDNDSNDDEPKLLLF